LKKKREEQEAIAKKLEEEILAQQKLANQQTFGRETKDPKGNIILLQD